MASLRLDKHDIHAQLMGKQTVPFCVVTKLLFSIVLLRSFSTVHLSNEENCCWSEGMGKLIKKKMLLKD